MEFEITSYDADGKVLVKQRVTSNHQRQSQQAPYLQRKLEGIANEPARSGTIQRVGSKLVDYFKITNGRSSYLQYTEEQNPLI
jgi:hypothetical protein